MTPPLLLTLLAFLGTTSAFVLPGVTMDQATWTACSTCDGRADRTFTETIAPQLREFLSKNQVRLAIERGEVVVRETFPNERIDTGHSCSVTAEARGVAVEAKMVNDKEFLDANLNHFHDGEYATFIDGKVPHQVDVTMDVRVSFGSKIISKCYNIARKTCGTQGTSTGQTYIFVQMIANNVRPYTDPSGAQFVEFELDVALEGKSLPATYSPMAVSGGCKLLFNIANMKSRMQLYTQQYLAKQNFDIIRSETLIKKLEDILKAPIKDGVVRIPVTVTGAPGRRRRAAPGYGCTKKTCLAGFYRLGNSDTCRKYFGRSRPACASYGPGAVLKTMKLGGGQVTIYYCEAPMVAA